MELRHVLAVSSDQRTLSSADSALRSCSKKAPGLFATCPHVVDILAEFLRGTCHVRTISVL
ncbi:hypothetical protein PF003_g37881 [Phytophthora fragariae]|nr:hypothetical protein PF003_g37881 [Phytophthora fragariae]